MILQEEELTQRAELEQGQADSFSIRVIHYDEQACSELTQAVVDFVESKHAELEEKLGEHESTAVNVSQAVVYDSRIAGTQLTIINNIINVYDAALKRKGDFVDKEWQYYDILVNGKNRDYSCRYSGSQPFRCREVRRDGATWCKLEMHSFRDCISSVYLCALYFYDVCI